jgi:hypothetical protein
VHLSSMSIASYFNGRFYKRMGGSLMELSIGLYAFG